MNILNISISGGGSGIGSALAKNFAGMGHKVIICGRRKEKLIETVGVDKNINYNVCDVRNEQSVIAYKNFIQDKLSHLDVIMNCAGLFGAIGRFDKTDSNEWRDAFDTNTFGTYLMTKHLLDLLLKSNIKKIINFAGGGAFGTFTNYSAYAVSKAAVVRFTENIAEELANLGVTANCVAPGFVTTEIHEATLRVGEETAGAQYNKTLLQIKSGAVPVQTIVECVKFLISPDADGLTGKTISASFDRWNSPVFHKSIQLINNSELYTMRRINLVNIDDNNKLKKIL
jgi:3-oxoacyl-[acyl-carrier protein] reductase